MAAEAQARAEEDRKKVEEFRELTLQRVEERAAAKQMRRRVERERCVRGGGRLRWQCAEACAGADTAALCHRISFGLGRQHEEKLVAEAKRAKLEAERDRIIAREQQVCRPSCPCALLRVESLLIARTELHRVCLPVRHCTQLAEETQARLAATVAKEERAKRRDEEILAQRLREYAPAPRFSPCSSTWHLRPCPPMLVTDSLLWVLGAACITASSWRRSACDRRWSA